MYETSLLCDDGNTYAQKHGRDAFRETFWSVKTVDPGKMIAKRVFVCK